MHALDQDQSTISGVPVLAPVIENRDVHPLSQEFQNTDEQIRMDMVRNNVGHQPELNNILDLLVDFDLRFQFGSFL